MKLNRTIYHSQMSIDNLKDYFSELIKYCEHDIKNGKIRTNEFMEAIRLSGKYCKFLPKYPELTDIIYKLRDEKRYAPRPIIPPGRQIEGLKPVSKEQAKKNISRIKNMMKGIG